MKPYTKGIVTITTTDAITGEVVDSFGPSENMVTDSGIATMWRRVSTLDETNQYQLNTLMLGDDHGVDDAGRWGIFNPEPPSRGFTKDNQNVTHTILPSKVEYDYPTDDVLRVRTYINGSVFMDDYYPAEVDYTFTSMTLRFNNDDIFAFKRFPIRSISRHVHVTIDWRFIMINANEWCALQAEGEG